MPRRPLLSIALAAILVPASVAGAATATTIHVVQHDAHFAFVDVAPKGGVRKPPTVGDQYVIGGRLTTTGGSSAGTSNLVCTVTQPGSRGASECLGTLTLAKGTVTFAGLSHQATSGDTFAIVGGTGAYRGATGLVVGTEGKGDDTNLAVELDG